MKVTKYFLIALAALTFSCCGSDDNDGDKGNEPGSETTFTSKEDLSGFVNANYKKLSQTYDDPDFSMNGIYSFSGNKTKNDKVETVTFMLNADEDKVYSVVEMLKEGSCKVSDMRKYFSQVYQLVENDGDSILTFANNSDLEKASLTIQVSSSSVMYANPQLAPDEPEGGDFADNPIDLVESFYNRNIADIIDEYDGVFSKVDGNSYMSVTDEVNDYVMAVGLGVEDDVVTKVTLLYNEDMSDEEIIEYYKGKDYTCTPTGKVDEEGNAEYLLKDEAAGAEIVFCAGIGVVTYTDALND